MANIRSAEKRARQNIRRMERNRIMRVTARSSVKNARTAIESGDAVAAQEAVLNAEIALDRAASKGVIHKNNASRRKGRIKLAYNKVFA